jgi:hypothetical protein
MSAKVVAKNDLFFIAHLEINSGSDLVEKPTALKPAVTHVLVNNRPRDTFAGFTRSCKV